ncbi:uncharacterized protein LOC107044876 isoform X1 [Diachasma alloeum]|uniref:uncharacterized protein LOC107044876 isoform X1 n=1 Tax=Diachasma alloeum TaxID=454923 RepID=UPI0007382613|nr:uncharacterized protein LOC107044876 isoform X1 [Diachasma alloeum]
MVESQDEYKSIYLKNDINYYQERNSVVSSKVNGSMDEIEVLNEQSEPISSSQELTDLSDLGKMFLNFPRKDDEEPLIQEMTSKENALFTIIREIKQFKFEISQL